MSEEGDFVQRDDLPPSAGGLDGLDRGSPVPLYHQLERALLELIVDTGLAPDARFPSESELSTRFGVTRPTVRQALERLVRVGVLRRERGRGTYVAAVPEVDASELTVKVIMPSLSDLIHLRVLAGIVDEAHRQGLQVILAHSDGKRAAQERELDRALGLSGVVLWPVNESVRSQALVRLNAAGKPVVLVDRYLDARADHVVVNDEHGGVEITDHLATLGHRRIAFIHSEPMKFSSVRLRFTGYRESLAANGLELDEDLVERTHEPESSVGAALDRLSALPDPPTAAFCVNDALAVELFTELRNRGIDVPGQFSVAGFDALEVLPSAGTLTSVRRATEEMGRQSIQLLIDRIKQPTAKDRPRHIMLPTALVPGDTTGPPPPTDIPIPVRRKKRTAAKT
jgi:DNA-binding LacI/PurR family transcriptional regulator